MTTSRVYVLTIPYPDWLCASARALAHTILRRRSDGPLIVRERERGTSQRSEDRGKLHYTSGRPHVQAIFSDPTALGRAQEELRTHVPVLPKGRVRHERRRKFRPELPCTCVLPGAKAMWGEGVAGSHTPIPSYSNVASCPRHSQLLPRPCTQLLAALIRQLELVLELPGRTPGGVPLLIDEPPVLTGRSSKSDSAARRAAKYAREGRKFALHVF